MSQKKIWNYFQNAGVGSFDQAEPRYRYLARQLGRRLKGRGKVLNIGVGNGGLERILVLAGYSVSSLDPDEQAILRLRSVGIDAHVGIVEALPFESATFDAVVASEVLEHLQVGDGRQAISEITRVLRTEGVFIGTVPYRERLVDNEVVCPHCGIKFHRWGHMRSFEVATLSDLLVNDELSLDHLSRRSFVQWKGGPSRLAKSTFKWLLGRLGEQAASPHFYFECRKIPRAFEARPFR